MPRRDKLTRPKPTRSASETNKNNRKFMISHVAFRMRKKADQTAMLHKLACTCVVFVKENRLSRNARSMID